MLRVNIFCSTSSSTAKGSNCYAYFTSFHALPSTFSPNSNRKMIIKLMEYDPQNSDDEVKVYKGSFSGRTLKSITYSSTTTPGNIEAAGNHICELYIKYKVDLVSGDPMEKYIYGGFFDYKVGIN